MKKQMTVANLIKALEGMNPKARVFVMPPRENGYHEVVDCEEEFSDTVSLGTKEKDYNKGCKNWEYYITYLMRWAEDHKSAEFEGMSPAGFDEFCDNDILEDE